MGSTLRPTSRLVTGVALVVCGAASLAAQSEPGRSTAGPLARDSGVVDSASVVRAVRSAQSTFERARRRYLPRTHSGPSGPCDETIGRYCYWDENSIDDVPLREPTPPESPRTVAARTRLLATLDSASRVLPTDGWIAGLHVHYLLEAGRFEEAAERARTCGAASWWCAALDGLAEHSAWRYAEADAAFARALATMPDSVRCDWTDLEVLLDDASRPSYRRVGCGERDSLNARIWWLADPSWLREGNDRRTEHFARATRGRIHRRAASGYGVAWRDDLDELARRFGWPSHFSQTLPAPYRTDGPLIAAFDPSPSYHFLANPALESNPRLLTDTTWSLRPRHTRERYAPPYATFWNLTQLATLFRRGDSTLLVVAYDASTDSLLRTAPVTAALVAARDPDPSAALRVVRHDAPARGTLALTLPDAPVVASAELAAGARVLRARFGVGYSGGSARALRISELALFEPRDSVPADLDAFLPLARASGSVAVDTKLGLFWELYGSPAAGEQLALDVEIVREGTGWLRRAGERIGLVNRAARVAFGWRETPRGDGVTPRALVIDLRGLDPGRYRIEVSLTPNGETPLIASRRIEITR